jgi:hypothetical protein
MFLRHTVFEYSAVACAVAVNCKLLPTVPCKFCAGNWQAQCPASTLQLQNRPTVPIALATSRALVALLLLLLLLLAYCCCGNSGKSSLSFSR